MAMLNWLSWLSLLGLASPEYHLRGAELVSERDLGSEVKTPGRRLPGLPGDWLAGVRAGP